MSIMSISINHIPKKQKIARYRNVSHTQLTDIWIHLKFGLACLATVFIPAETTVFELKQVLDAEDALISVPACGLPLSDHECLCDYVEEFDVVCVEFD